jgi:hypothetical protein
MHNDFIFLFFWMQRSFRSISFQPQKFLVGKVPRFTRKRQAAKRYGSLI